MEHFDKLKKLFLLDFSNVMEMDEVPAELVVNWDQSSINYVPVSSWTMAEEGSKTVDVAGKDQLTAVFACSMSGDFFPFS